MISTPHKDRGHSTVMGGSTAAQIIACPGSLGLSAKVGKSPSSSYAEEGTALHEAIAYILNENVDVRMVLGLNFNDHIISDEQIREALQPAIDSLDDYLGQIEDEDGGEFQFTVEQFVDMPGIEGAFGSADLVGATPKRSVVLDWKFGSGVAVYAEENKQGMFYGRSAMHSLPKFFSEDPNWPVDIIVAQPRLESFDVWQTTVGALEQFRYVCVKAVAEAKSADPPFEEGDHCRFCDAKPLCPLKNAAMGGISDRAEMYGGGIPPEMEDCMAVMEQAADVEEYIASVRAFVHNRMVMHGFTHPDWKIVAKKANRGWADQKKAEGYLARNGVAKDDRMPRKLISPAAAEKLLKPKKIPESYIQAGVSSGTNLVRSTAKGEAITSFENTTSNTAKENAEKLKGTF